MKLFSALTPTPDTGVAQTVQASFSATNGLLCVRNASALKYRPRYLRLVNTVVGTSTTRSECLVAVDQGTARYASGGSQLTPKARDTTRETDSSALVYFGGLTLNAESASVRRLARFQMRGAIMQQFEEWLIVFGRSGHNYNVLGGGSVQRQVVDAEEVILGPSKDLLVHLWHVGNSGTPPQWEAEFCWGEESL